MRVLLVNDFVSSGGTEVQHWREYDLFAARGHDVYSLTMDSDVDECLSGRKRNVAVAGGPLGKTLSRTFVGIHLRALRAQVDDIDPDVIHLNNVRNAPLDVYRIVRDCPCIQTVRDYGAVCPKGTCIHGDGTQCRGYRHEDCFSCGLSAKELVKAGQMERLSSACAEACDVLVAPSEAPARCCSENGLPAVRLNDPCNFPEDGRESRGHARKAGRTFLYYGLIDRKKGVGELFAAFDVFAGRHPDAALVLAGDVAGAFVPFFKEQVAKRGYATYVGRLPYDEMLNLVRDVHCVVVPSLWIENYPSTVLEAMACRTLVIGSNRGGIPEMLCRPELLFDVLDKTSIAETLEFAYGLDALEYEKIVDEGYRRVSENNTVARYAERLEVLFGEAVAKHHAGGPA